MDRSVRIAEKIVESDFALLAFAGHYRRKRKISPLDFSPFLDCRVFEMLMNNPRLVLSG